MTSKTNIFNISSIILKIIGIRERILATLVNTLCSYGVMNVINYRVGSRGKMGGVNLCVT